MKLLRYGNTGFEKPGLMDSEGNIRDLSAVVDDITGAVLDDGKLTDLKALDHATLPLVSADTRLGPCVCLLYTSPSPRDRTRSRMPSSA